MIKLTERVRVSLGNKTYGEIRQIKSLKNIKQLLSALNDPSPDSFMVKHYLENGSFYKLRIKGRDGFAKQWILGINPQEELKDYRIYPFNGPMLFKPKLLLKSFISKHPEYFEGTPDWNYPTIREEKNERKRENHIPF